MSLSYNRPEASTMRCSEKAPRSRLLLPADPPRMQVPTIDTFGCARFHPFGNGKPQKRAGPATRERRKPWRRQAPNRRLVSLVVGP